MKDFDKILLSQLKDIHGLHEVSMWPLAPGWWLFVFLLSTAAFVVIKKIIRLRKFKKSWRYKLYIELENIAQSADVTKAKQNISRINDILKRLAIKQYGRAESASLSGKKWLAWLTNRDPKNFNWVKKGEILVEHPYMPEEKIKAASEQISALAKAVKSWLKEDV